MQSPQSHSSLNAELYIKDLNFLVGSNWGEAPAMISILVQSMLDQASVTDVITILSKENYSCHVEPGILVIEFPTSKMNIPLTPPLSEDVE